MRGRCLVTSSFYVSFKKCLVTGHLSIKVSGYNDDSICFRVSSQIAIDYIKINSNELFYSRSGDGEQNVIVFLPSDESNLMWSPIPKLNHGISSASHFIIDIEFTIKSKSASIIWQNTFVNTSNIPFSLAGWMPVIDQAIFTEYNTLTVKIDEPSFLIFGPYKKSEVINSTYKESVFDISQCVDPELIGWAAGNAIVTQIASFKIYSLWNYGITNLDFLETISSELTSPPPTFLILPHTYSDIEITTGYIMLSNHLLKNTYNLATLMPIPASYRLVSAISYAVSFYQNLLKVRIHPNQEWFFLGIANYLAEPYVRLALGQSSADYYLYLQMLRLYNPRFNDCSSRVKKNSWDHDNWANIRIKLAFNIIAAYVPDGKMDDFVNSIPKNTTQKQLFKYLGKFMDDPKSFFTIWYTERAAYPIVINLDVLNQQFKSITELRVKSIGKIQLRTNALFPATIRVFTPIGAVSEDVFIPISKESCFSFEFQKKRQTATQKSDEKSIVTQEGITFVVLETRPIAPIFTVYEYTPSLIINIIKTYGASVYAQHEAIHSLAQFAMTRGDDSDHTILNFLGTIINSSSFFYSLRVHALRVLTMLIDKNINEMDQEVVRDIIINFFTREIASEDSTRLMELDHLHPCIIIEAFRAITRIGHISGSLSSYDYLFRALIQASGTLLEPHLVKALVRVPFPRVEDRQQFLKYLVDRLEHTEDHYLLTAYISVAFPFFNSMGNLTFSKYLNEMHRFILTATSSDVRIAAASYFGVRNPCESFAPFLSMIRAEIDKPYIDYVFVSAVVGLLIDSMIALENDPAKKLSTDEIRERISTPQVFEDVCLLMTVVEESYPEIFEMCERFYKWLYKQRWEMRKIPDGIIKAVPLQFYGDFDDGLFSDDSD